MSAYLTFDDGPMYPNTERVLEILADFEVAATFFMVGQNVDANPSSPPVWCKRATRLTTTATRTPT